MSAVGRGLSAAGAKKIIRRAKKVRLISPPIEYTVTDFETNTLHTGTFKDIAALCPKIKTSTLKRRLESGERNLSKLRRKPEPRQGARSRRARR